MDTLEAIKELAAKQFGREPESIDADAPVDQMGIDSLGFLEFLFELEDRFSISIPQDDVTGVRTLRDLAARIDVILATPKPATPT